ncbi:hypothetical protein FTP56_20445 [Salmonella enterica]|nr:hypothetical protein [Salmonella enterica]
MYKGGEFGYHNFEPVSVWRVVYLSLNLDNFEWVHVLLRQQKMVISLPLPDICNSAVWRVSDGHLAGPGWESVFTLLHLTPRQSA